MYAKIPLLSLKPTHATGVSVYERLILIITFLTKRGGETPPVHRHHRRTSYLRSRTKCEGSHCIQAMLNVHACAINGQNSAGRGQQKPRNDLRTSKWLLVLVWWVQINTLPKTNIAPEMGHPKRNFHLPTIHFHLLCWLQGVYRWKNVVSTNTHENWLFVVPG